MPPNQRQVEQSLKTEIDQLQSKVSYLEEANDALDKMCKEEVIDCESAKAELKDETQKLSNLHLNFVNLDLRLRNAKSESSKLEEIW